MEEKEKAAYATNPLVTQRKVNDSIGIIKGDQSNQFAPTVNYSPEWVWMTRNLLGSENWKTFILIVFDAMDHSRMPDFQGNAEFAALWQRTKIRRHRADGTICLSPAKGGGHED
jgi:hypothetical protein